MLAVFVACHHKMSKLTSQVIIQELKLLPDKINKILKGYKEIENIAKDFVKTKNLVILGRKFNYPQALEGAQKIKEVAQIQIEGYASEEFIHGPNAIIKQGYPVIAICPKDSVYDDNVKVLKKIKKDGAEIYAITTRGNKKIKNISKEVIFIPEAGELLTPILTVIPCQLIAYFLAVHKKLNVDNPDNLKKYIKKDS